MKNIDELQAKIEKIELDIEVYERINNVKLLMSARIELAQARKELNDAIQLMKDNTVKKDEFKIFIPTHNDITTSLSSGEFAFMTKLLTVTNFTDVDKRVGVDMEAYLYEKELKDKLNELKEQKIKIPSKNTLKKYMKTFSNITIDGDSFHLMNVFNTPQGLCYQFKQSYNGKYFIAIPSKMLREMHLGLKDNPIKVYCIVARKLQMNNEYTKFTREYICKGMGLEPNEGNLNHISTYLNILRKLGYIKIKYEWFKVMTDEGEKMEQVMYIRLATYQEWLEK